MKMTKRLGTVIVPLLLAASLLTGPGSAEAGVVRAAGDVDEGVARPDLQHALDEVVRLGASAAIAEVRDGHGRWRGASGIERMGSRRPAPVDGRFRAASVTKAVVATVTLQLVGEGRLGLDDSVEHWLPGLLPGGAGITVRQLLNHTSGLFNYEELAPPGDNEAILNVRFRTVTPYELIALATAQPPYFPPGKGWHYASTNYIVVGLIIEKVTGRPYADAVNSRILRPLGMRNTYVPGR